MATGNATPSWGEPQLDTLTHERFSDPSWIYERKLDGERCLAFAEHEITTTFPEIATAVAAQHHGDLVVDGEIVAFDGAQTRFERLQRRLGLASPSQQLLRDFPVFCFTEHRPGDGTPYWEQACRDGDPQRSRVGFGALLLGCHDAAGDLVYAGKVGTGFDTKTLLALHDRLARLELDRPAFSRGRLPAHGLLPDNRRRGPQAAEAASFTPACACGLPP